MSGTPFTPPRFIPVNSSGRPYPGARLRFFRAGTTTPATVYTNSALTVAHPAEIRANAAGMFDAVYLDPNSGFDYKAVLQNSSGVQLWSEDNIPASSDVSADEVGQALYPRSAEEIAEGVTPASYQYPVGHVQRYGADPSGTADSTPAINTAIDVVWAATYGGVVTFPVGEFKVTSTIVLPKGISKTLRIVGAGPRSSVLYAGSNIAAGTPMIRWDTSAAGSVQLHSIENLGIVRLNGGPLLQFRQNAGSTGGLGDRIAIVLRGLVLRQSSTAGSGASLDFEYSLKSYVERVWFEGGNPSGVCVQWTNCSQDYFCEIYGNGKSTIGDFFFVNGGGDLTVVASRSEGCAGNFFWKLLDCDHVTIISPWTESDQAADVFLLDGARYCAIESPSIGNQVGATNPNGIRMISTNRGCVGNIITGGKTSSFDALGTGHTVSMNSNAAGNIVQNLVVEGVATVSGEVSLAGTDNFITLIAGAGTPPTVQTFSAISAGGVKARGTAAQFGTADNFTVDLIQNNNTIATLSSSALTMAAGIALRAANHIGIVDGISAPSTVAGQALLYVDTSDGDLKVKFGDGTVKTIVTDT